MTRETLRSGGRSDRPAATLPIGYADTAASTQSQGRRRTLPGRRTTTILIGAAAALAGTALIVNWQGLGRPSAGIRRRGSSSSSMAFACIT
jgi:hypothetical protein